MTCIRCGDKSAPFGLCTTCEDTDQLARLHARQDRPAKLISGPRFLELLQDELDQEIAGPAERLPGEPASDDPDWVAATFAHLQGIGLIPAEARLHTTPHAAAHRQEGPNR